MLVGTIFYLLFLIPNIGRDWLSYILPAAIVIALPLIFAVKERYNRADLDDEESDA